MNQAELGQFRQRLLELRTECRNFKELTKESTIDAREEATSGGLSRGEAMQTQLIARKAANQLQRQLDKIEGAFRRIEARDYGNCFICSEEIDIDRLLADPTSTRCLECDEG